MQSKALKYKFEWRNYIVYLVFVVVLVFFIITIGGKGFTQVSNLMSIIRTTTMTSLLAVAMTFAIAAGEFDLSVGSVAAFGAIFAAIAMQAGGNFIVGILAGLAGGAIVGAVNGALVGVLRIPSFIVTVGMAMIIRGADQWLTNTKPILIGDPTFRSIFGHAEFGPVPVMLVWTIAALIIGHLVLKKTSFGREVLATGGNRVAAEYSGVNTKKIKFLVLLITGMAAAISGMLFAGMMSTARSTIGEGGLELNAIAAAILGGAALSGGKGSIIGAVVASLLIGIINNGIVIMGLNIAQQNMVTGAIIILAIAFGGKRLKV
jgi:ribose transport system permease protein